MIELTKKIDRDAGNFLMLGDPRSVKDNPNLSKYLDTKDKQIRRNYDEKSCSIPQLQVVN